MGDKNSDADDFLASLKPEDPIERAGRHYAESRSRQQTEEAVSDLARAVSSIAKAQTETSRLISELQTTMAAMQKRFETMTGWMEGSIDEKGTRTPGFLDQIATFRKWRDFVTTALTATAIGALSTAAIALVRLVLDFSHPAIH